MSSELEICVDISAFFLNWRNYRYPQLRCGTHIRSSWFHYHIRSYM